MNSQDSKEHIGIYFFFLSDCGPSAGVANTLYRSENENLCVCLAQLRAGAGAGGISFKSDLVRELWMISSPPLPPPPRRVT